MKQSSQPYKFLCDPSLRVHKDKNKDKSQLTIETEIFRNKDGSLSYRQTLLEQRYNPLLNAVLGEARITLSGDNALTPAKLRELADQLEKREKKIPAYVDKEAEAVKELLVGCYTEVVE